MFLYSFPLCKVNSVLLRRLALVQLTAKVLWSCIQQPVSVHQAQVSHVAAGCVQQLIEHHVRRLGLEEDRGRVDGHRLVRVQGQVAAVGLELCSVDEHPVGEALANVPCVCPARLQLQVQLVDEQRLRSGRRSQCVSDFLQLHKGKFIP